MRDAYAGGEGLVGPRRWLGLEHLAVALDILGEGDRLSHLRVSACQIRM